MNNNLDDAVVVFIDGKYTYAFNTKNQAENWIEEKFDNWEKVRETWSTDYHGYIFVNYKTFKSSFVYLKFFTGLYDKMGLQIYFGDKLSRVDENNNEVEDFTWSITYITNNPLYSGKYKDGFYLIAYPKGLGTHKQKKIKENEKILKDFIIHTEVNKRYKFKIHD